MRIAVAFDEGNVSSHFGRTRTFAMFDEDDEMLGAPTLVDVVGSGHASLAPFLRDRGVDVLICGGIGAGAQQALAANGIFLCAGIEGPVEAAARAFAEGRLSHHQNATCRTHDAQGHASSCECSCSHPHGDARA